MEDGVRQHNPRLQRAADDIRASILQGAEPRHMSARGRVSSVVHNDAGLVTSVTVTQEGGVAISGVIPNGLAGLGEGSAVELDGLGRAGGVISWRVSRIIEAAPGGGATEPNTPYSTPTIYEVVSNSQARLAGSRLVDATVIVGMVAEQYRYRIPTYYEVQVRDSDGVIVAEGATQTLERVAATLDANINNAVTALAANKVTTPTPVPQFLFPDRYFVILVDSEKMRVDAVSDTSATEKAFSSMTRAYSGTAAAAHTADHDITLVGLPVVLTGLASDTAYEARARACAVDGRQSTWTDWEAFDSAINGQVPPFEPRGTSLVTNSTFNANTNNWTHSTLGTGSKNHDTSVYFNGGGSMRLDETRNAGLQLTFDVTSDAFTVTAANEFYARVMLRMSGLTDAQDRVGFVIRNSATNVAYARIDYVGTQIASGTGEWTAAALTGFVPSGVTSLEVFIDTTIDLGAGNVSLWIDEVFVVQTAQTRISSPTQLQIGSGATITQVLTAVASLNFGSIAQDNDAELTITVTGAASGDMCNVTPASGIEADLAWCGFVSAADTVTVRLINNSAGSIDPAARNWRATVIKF
jgi:hypothetical protein